MNIGSDFAGKVIRKLLTHIFFDVPVIQVTGNLRTRHLSQAGLESALFVRD
jgi:hypothetical protein